MEKISGIIPKSPRVSAVDLKESAPVRPGTPSFGRLEGANALRDNPTQGESTARRSNAIREQQIDWRSKETRQAAIASDMSEKFFMKGPPPAAEAVVRPGAGEPEVRDVETRSLGAPRSNSTPVVSKPAGFKTNDTGSFAAASARPDIAFKAAPAALDEEPMLAQPEGLFPKGFFIDRTA